MWKAVLCSCQFEYISPIDTTTLSFSGMSLCLGRSMHAGWYTVSALRVPGSLSALQLKVLVTKTDLDAKTGIAL